MTHRVEAPEDGRLDRVLSRALPDLSRSRLAALIRAGRVRVDGREVRRPAHPVEAGAVLSVEVPDPAPTHLVGEPVPIEVLYEDRHLAVVVKPAGMPTHPGPGHASGTLAHALVHRFGRLSSVGGVQRPGIVHRLDKGTSGILVVALDDAAHQGLQAMFQRHDVDRRYLALVQGGPDLEAGTIRSHLGRHPHDRLRQASLEVGGRLAVTHWRLVERFEAASLLECRLETGRTHQVRVHLAESGWPILGDRLYAGHRHPRGWLRHAEDALDRPLLHAWRLAFTHPITGRDLAFEKAPDGAFAELLEQLRGSRAAPS